MKTFFFLACCLALAACDSAVPDLNTVTATASTAHSTSAPLGRCPRGFELRHVGVETETTTFPENFARSMNGDGYLCYKQQDHPHYGDDFYIDNDIPFRR